MLNRVLALAKIFLFSPYRAAEAARRQENLTPGLAIYAAFTAASIAFLCVKPADFPDAGAPLPSQTQGLAFWLRVSAWQPPLEAAWIVFLMGLIRFFSAGSWVLRLVAAVAWTSLPFILMVLYTTSAIPQPLLAAGLALWLGLLAASARRTSRQDWKALVTYMLALNIIGLAIMIPLCGAAWARHSGLFTFSQAAGGLWILGCATVGLRELTGLRLPRAFMAVLLSMFSQIAFAFALHLLGLVPKEILKALFYA